MSNFTGWRIVNSKRWNAECPVLSAAPIWKIKTKCFVSWNTLNLLLWLWLFLWLRNNSFGNGFCQYVIDSFVIWCEICPRLRIQLYLLIGLARSQQTNKNIRGSHTAGREEGGGGSSHLMGLNTLESDWLSLSLSVYVSEWTRGGYRHVDTICQDVGQQWGHSQTKYSSLGPQGGQGLVHGLTFN